jgi:Transposase and inactivated derivatives
MLREKAKAKQERLEMVQLEELVPKDHLLRKIDAAVDFSFIYDMCKDLYSTNIGRPAIQPELLFRMLLLGYLYGIKSEVRLAEQVNDSMSFKWFLGLGLTEKGPDHATISINRVRRFRDKDIAEKIFDEILRQCVAKGLVGGEILYTDSTHVKAKANKHRKALVTVEETPKSYIEELNEQVDLDRHILKKKGFNRDDGPPADTGGKQAMKSTTDPDSGQLSKEGKPDGFHYSEHRTVDSKNNVVGNVHITAANINDMTPVPSILEEIRKRLGKLPKYMGLDAGYHSAAIAHLLERNHIQGVIGYRRHTHKGERMGKWRFHYNGHFDAYECPNHQRLYWTTTDRDGFRHYGCKQKICASCPLKEKCLAPSIRRKEVLRHVWQDALEDINIFTKTPQGKRLYNWRKETIERSFAEAKENHGLRYARMLGIRNMREQSFLTAAVQNIKRLAKAFSFYFSHGGLRSVLRKRIVIV